MFVKVKLLIILWLLNENNNMSEEILWYITTLTQRYYKLDVEGLIIIKLADVDLNTHVTNHLDILHLYLKQYNSSKLNLLDLNFISNDTFRVSHPYI